MSSVLRCLNLAKQFKGVLQSANSRTTRVPIRLSHDEGWAYRRCNPSPQSEKLAQYVCAAAWWWFLWHCWHDYDLVTGEFPNLFPEEWTDEELGIAPE